MSQIKLKSGELGMLRNIANSPRTTHSLTHVNGVADVQLAPHTVRSYLEHLAEIGLIAAPQRRDGSYVVTDEGREYLDGLPQLVPSTLIANASMKEPYVPPVWPVRVGGDQHRQFASRGLGT